MTSANLVASLILRKSLRGNSAIIVRVDSEFYREILQTLMANGQCIEYLSVFKFHDFPEILDIVFKKLKQLFGHRLVNPARYNAVYERMVAQEDQYASYTQVPSYCNNN
nr:ASN_HP1_G0028520.mRNA.1.CDS.1 [Saccharomyces cerevisiae]